MDKPWIRKSLSRAITPHVCDPNVNDAFLHFFTLVKGHDTSSKKCHPLSKWNVIVPPGSSAQAALDTHYNFVKGQHYVVKTACCLPMTTPCILLRTPPGAVQ